MMRHAILASLVAAIATLWTLLLAGMSSEQLFTAAFFGLCVSGVTFLTALLLSNTYTRAYPRLHPLVYCLAHLLAGVAIGALYAWLLDSRADTINELVFGNISLLGVVASMSAWVYMVICAPRSKGERGVAAWLHSRSWSVQALLVIIGVLALSFLPSYGYSARDESCHNPVLPGKGGASPILILEFNVEEQQVLQIDDLYRRFAVANQFAVRQRYWAPDFSTARPERELQSLKDQLSCPA